MNRVVNNFLKGLENHQRIHLRYLSDSYPAFFLPIATTEGVVGCGGSRTVEAVNEGGLRLHQTATTDAREDRHIGGLMVAQPDSALRRQD